MSNSAVLPKFTHITFNQRVIMEALKSQGLFQKPIGVAVGVNQSSVSREFTRHSVGGVYDAAVAQVLADGVKHIPYIPRILDTCSELVEHIIHHLRNKRSVSQALYLVAQKHPQLPTVCVDTVYTWAYTTDSPEAVLICKLMSRPRRKRKSRGKGSTNKGKLKNQKNISQRSKLADKRRVFGFWEGDLVIGKAGKTAVATLVERKTRYRASPFKLVTPGI